MLSRMMSSVLPMTSRSRSGKNLSALSAKTDVKKDPKEPGSNATEWWKAPTAYNLVEFGYR